MGGQHPGRGTCNALLSLGPSTYLELIGPDPEQPPPSNSRPFGLDFLRSPSLRGWAVAPDDIAAAVLEAGRHGHVLSPLVAGRRRAPSGPEISWRMAWPEFSAEDAPPVLSGTPAPLVLPFFIEWGTSPHPASGAPDGLTLGRYVLLTPVPWAVRELLEELGLDGPWEVEASPAAALRAEITDEKGRTFTLVS
jgi:hypothetical protein